MNREFTRGNSIYFVCELPVIHKNSRVDITNEYITFTLKRNKTDADPGIFQKKFQAPAGEFSEKGLIVVDIPYQESESIPVGLYYYDVQARLIQFSPDGLETPESGRIKIVQDITLDTSIPAIPQITSFSIPQTHNTSLVVPVTSFAAENATYYQITTSSSQPTIAGGGWSTSIPTSYTVAAEGSNTLFPWCHDGLTVSSVSTSKTVTVDLPSTVEFSAASVGVDEGSSVLLTLTRSGSIYGSLTVSVAQTSGSAISGIDYTLSPVTVTWDNGDAVAKTITLAGVADQLTEGTEAVVFTITGTSGQYIYGGNRSITVTLNDTSQYVIDSTPDQFTIADQAGVTLSTPITSVPFTVSGINAATAISVIGGTYSINGGLYTSSPGTVVSNDLITVRHTSSGSYGSATNTVLTIGGVSDVFTSTTVTEDLVPNQFTFTPLVDRPVSTEVFSNVVVIQGINSTATFTVTGAGTAQKNATGSWVTSGSVVNLDTLQLKHTTSSTNGAQTATTLTISGVASTFTTTNIATTWTATHYATASGAGTHDGSVGNEWSYVEAFNNAPAGAKVQFAPGTGTATAADSSWVPAFRVANPGSAGNHTVFFAQYPKVLNPGNPSLWTNLRHDGTTSVNCPLVGSYGESYITIDGFNLDEAYAIPHSGTGIVTINTLGSQVRDVVIRRCGIKGITPTHGDWAIYPTDNHSGVRIESAYNITIEDNEITGFRNPRDSHNGSGIMTYANGYDTYNVIIRNNNIDDCGSGVYIKGQISALQSFFQVYKNKITRCTQKGIYINGITGTTGGRTSVYQNIIINPIPVVYDGVMNFSSIYFGDEAAHVDVANNTCYRFDNTVDRGIGSVSDCRVRNNIGKEMAVGSLNRYFFAMFNDARAALSPDHNCWNSTGVVGRWLYFSTNYATLASWVTALGGTYAENDIYADPLFVDAANGDFRIQDTANSIGAGTSPCLNRGVDILDLKGNGTSASINMGAYITANQTDYIGPRP